MSFSNIRTAIETHFAGYTGAPKIFAENKNIPAGAQSQPWARWSIRESLTLDSEVGARKERTFGVMYFQHFIPEEQGTTAATTFSDKIAAFLNRKILSAGGDVITFERAQLKYVGMTEGYSQHNITIDFRADGPAVNAA